MTDRNSSLRLSGDLKRNFGLLSQEGIREICSRDTVVFLESVLARDRSNRTLIFLDPVEIIRAVRVREVVPALVRAQMYLEQGLYVAGYVSYEAAPAFLPVPERDPSDEPPFMVWLGVFKDPIIRERVPGPEVPSGTSGFTIGQVDPSIREVEYFDRMKTIRRYLEEGHTYQVNYTYPVTGRWSGSLADLYLRLRMNQRVEYGAIIRHDTVSILSFSPELFFSVRGNDIVMKPMKGTAARGRHLEEDERNVRELSLSEKERAENRMIVDLLRNDLGRVAQPGSVKVRSFFDVERLETVLQATSTITAGLNSPPALTDLFQAFFPCGSVTGAPKIETMKIIHEVEQMPRGVYTGAIGYAAPTGDMTFNVAIRTLLADERTGVFRFNVGSGVTIASDPAREFQECQQKTLFVTREPVQYLLFETIRWTRENGFEALAAHISRMGDSAKYFGWRFVPPEVLAYLQRIEREIPKSPGKRVFRVRLSLDRRGDLTHDIAPLAGLKEPVTVGFSRKRISTEDRFQYHKTTNRQTYDLVLEEATARGWFDAIVLNERGEVAEGARTNVFVERGSVLYTPPISAGILAGIMRGKVLSSTDRICREQILRTEDVVGADRVFLSNALRGLIEAEVVG